MPLFSKPKYSTVAPSKKKDIPKDLYTRCPESGDIVYTKELEKNHMVVPKSGCHLPIDAPHRVESLVDPGSWEETDRGLLSVDVLNFKGKAKYAEKLARDQAKTGLEEAVVTGVGRMGGIEVSLAVTDFRFLAGSMGSVVGEKITRAVERATERRLPVIIVSASGGGARMYEGVISLMQLAKTSAALARHRAAGLPYISVLTDPTYGGVTASFATLGDLNLAEPKARIGFAGPRVIKEGTNQVLPEGFQTAEFLLERGLIDQIVPRLELRPRIIGFLHVFHLRKAPPEKVVGA